MFLQLRSSSEGPPRWEPQPLPALPQSQDLLCPSSLDLKLQCPPTPTRLQVRVGSVAAAAGSGTWFVIGFVESGGEQEGFSLMELSCL